MDGTILVTGGTGTLGRTLVGRLRAAGREPLVLSRRAGPGRVVADLDSGDGLSAAVRDVDVVVHAATRIGHDVAATERLVAALRDAGGRAHLVYVSIVGIDAVPLGYYREKLAVEEVVAASGLGWTVQRATQFHDLVEKFFVHASRLGVLPVPAGTGVQPVDTRDVADRLVELAGAAPAGRAPDLGGPEVRSTVDLARVWRTARGRRSPVWPVRLPGRIARGFRDGGHLTPAHAEGRITFEQYLATIGSRP